MSERLERASARAGVFRDLYRMAQRSRRWWLYPMIFVLLILGLALSGLQAVHFIAPFMYAVL